MAGGDPSESIPKRANYGYGTICTRLYLDFMPMTAQDHQRAFQERHTRDRERSFLEAYLDDAASNLAHGDHRAAAEIAGYGNKTSYALLDKILKKWAERSFGENAQLFGLHKPYLAMKMKKLLDNPATKPPERIACIKLLLNNFGEKTEDGATTVNVNTPKALVVVGGSEKRLREMVAPQLEEQNG